MAVHKRTYAKDEHVRWDASGLLNMNPNTWFLAIAIVEIGITRLPNQPTEVHDTHSYTHIFPMQLRHGAVQLRIRGQRMNNALMQSKCQVTQNLLRQSRRVQPTLS